MPLVAGLALAQAGTADMAGAQGTLEIRPTLRMSEVYESNLFSAPDNGGLTPDTAPRQDDVISRLSPGVESDYRTPRLSASARYTLDAERFAKHHDLTSPVARQHATAALAYRATPRVRVNGGGDFVTTRTPQELNVLSGLAFTRTRGSRLSAHSTLTRELNPVTAGSLEYTFSRDRVGRGFEAHAHGVAVVGTRRVSPRTQLRGGYRGDRYVFMTTSIDRRVLTSHSLNAEVTREITPRLTASLEAGPRVTEDVIRPELSASVAWNIPRGVLSLAYRRTQTTVFGAAGAADVQSVRVSLARTYRRSFELRLTPAVFTTALGGQRADVYALAAGLVRRLSNVLALELSVDGTVQRGNLYRAANGDTIPRHTAVIRFVAAPTGGAR